MMNDLISRKALCDYALNQKDKSVTPNDIMRFPSAQPEIKPIDYQDCANAMLRMWMDEVITDGEYNRVMDKLNAFWRTRNERSNQQTGGD